MCRVFRKLRLLKAIIHEFSKSNFSDLEKRVKEAHELLLRSQDQILGNPKLANAKVEVAALLKGKFWQKLRKFFLRKEQILLGLDLGIVTQLIFT